MTYQDVSKRSHANLDFKDTAVAFERYSDSELRRSLLLFKVIGVPQLAKYGPGLASASLKLGLPIRGLLKESIFGQFCGGESIEECLQKIAKLSEAGVGTILDYATEAVGSEAGFDKVAAEVKSTIHLAAKNKAVPFAVFKPTGIGRAALLEKCDRGLELTSEESSEYKRFENRVASICRLAFKLKVRVLVDAEESWIQKTVDDVTTRMMRKYNQSQAIVYNTIQLYRRDKVEFLKESHKRAQDGGYQLGLKLVRGAYIEKETEYAHDHGTVSPLHSDKPSVDKDYDDASLYCLHHLEGIAVCYGTHNEESVKKICQTMSQLGISSSDSRIHFAQLYGMSDNLSFNLARADYQVCKYLPYGKLEELLPYLSRRAQENSSIQGQSSRELKLIQEELRRRTNG